MVVVAFAAVVLVSFVLSKAARETYKDSISVSFLYIGNVSLVQRMIVTPFFVINTFFVKNYVKKFFLYPEYLMVFSAPIIEARFESIASFEALAKKKYYQVDDNDETKLKLGSTSTSQSAEPNKINRAMEKQN